MIVFANGAAKAEDTDGNVQNIAVMGPEQNAISIHDEEQYSLLNKIIKQLLILNQHMQLITDTEIKKHEVEV